MTRRDGSPSTSRGCRSYSGRASVRIEFPCLTNQLTPVGVGTTAGEVSRFGHFPCRASPETSRRDRLPCRRDARRPGVLESAPPAPRPCRRLPLVPVPDNHLL